MKKPKMLVRDEGLSIFSSSPREVANNTGEWPYTFGLWKMTFYPYVHTTTGEVVWLEPETEHLHLFTTQNVKKMSKLPEWNPATLQYDLTKELPFCFLCGVFMEDEHYESFMKSLKLTELAVQDTKNDV